jgi:hypothetical protein
MNEGGNITAQSSVSETLEEETMFLSMKYPPIIDELRKFADFPWSFIEEVLKDVPKEGHFDYLCDVLDTFPEFDKKEWEEKKKKFY